MPITNCEYTHIHNIILNSSRHFGSKTYIESVDQGKSISFGELNKQSNKVAGFLKSRGLTKHDRVALIGRNSIETIITFLGVMRYGAIICPINADESEENVFGIVERLQPRMVIYDRGINLRHRKSGCLWLPFAAYDEDGADKDDFFTSIQDHQVNLESPLGGKDDIGEILFTSGTTGRPKGVAISREAHFRMVEEVIDKLELRESDKMLEYRAYSWASAQLLSVLTTLTIGATLVLARKFSRSRFVDWLKDHEVTISSGVPTVINMLLNDPVSLHKREVPHLKYITSSSAPLSVEKQQAFESRYGIEVNQMAGMTEGGWVFGNPPGRRKRGSVGTPFKFKDVRIIDEKGDQCKVGEEGEILVRGKSFALGYLNDEGEIDKFPVEGFSTGDLGYLDSEGYFFISGRKKDLVIRGGVNIAPKEITDLLVSHPAIVEAMTIGVPDNIYGEELAAFIITREDHPLTLGEVRTFCAEHLPKFKIPKYILCVDQIPRTKTGKVARSRLLDFFNKSLSSEKLVNYTSVKIEG